MQRLLPTLILTLLMCTAGSARANSPSAAIADLNISLPTGDGLLASIRRDLSVAGYRLNEEAQVLRGLNGAIEVKEPWSEANELLQKAEQVYEGFELKEALEALDSIDALLLDTSPEPQGKALLARRFLLEGLIRFAQGKTARAIHGFRLTHRLTPSFVKLDAGKHRPAVVKLYAQAVQENKDASPITLSHKLKPKDAALHVDGAAMEKGQQVPQGPHVVMISADGYEPQSSVRSFGEQVKLKTALKPLSLTEHLRSLRREAALSRDKSPKRFQELAEQAEVDILVLVHNGPEGPRAAIYSRADESLSPWVRVGSVRWQSLLTTSDKEASKVVAASPSGARPAKPWHRKWWGASLIIGGTAAVATGLYFALSSGDSGGGGVTIDEWCFGSCE
jgi:hypothetical protein